MDDRLWCDITPHDFLTWIFDLGNQCHRIAVTVMLSHGIPPVIVAGVTCSDLLRMLDHSISILLTTYAHFILVLIRALFIIVRKYYPMQ
jgi:hypothetical protein